jgi:hypothetical protein
MADITFQNDIVPIFKPFQENMMWRFDLTSYDTVVANADMIYARISNQDGAGYMPPPPFSPLTNAQIDMFHQWMTSGFKP